MDAIDHSTAIHQTIQAVSALSDLFDNGDGKIEDAAVNAASENRASYWSNARIGNEPAMRLLRMANDGTNLDAALSALKYTQASQTELLFTLIPLNVKAVMEIREIAGD